MTYEWQNGGSVTLTFTKPVSRRTARQLEAIKAEMIRVETRIAADLAKRCWPDDG